MDLADIDRQEREIGRLLSRSLQLEDPEDQAHWARYLCVLASGLLQNAFLTIYVGHARERAPERVANFVERTLERYFQNPSWAEITNWVDRFDPAWESWLKVQASEQAKAAINSIVENRNRIAHGKDTPDLTVKRLQGYFAEAMKVIELMRRQCEL